jgi:hypothetical protein
VQFIKIAQKYYIINNKIKQSHMLLLTVSLIFSNNENFEKNSKHHTLYILKKGELGCSPFFNGFSYALAYAIGGRLSWEQVLYEKQISYLK